MMMQRKTCTDCMNLPPEKRTGKPGVGLMVFRMVQLVSSGLEPRGLFTPAWIEFLNT